MAAMFRALSTRGSRKGSGYDKLVDESTTDLLNGAKLSRSKTAASPGRFFSVSNKKSVTPDRSDYYAKSPEYNFQTKVWTPEVKFQTTQKADAQANRSDYYAKSSSTTPEYNFQTKVWTPEAKFQTTTQKADAQAKYAAKEAKKASKIHPLFSLFFEKSRRKKPTAKPEFARYVQYLKEGGVWDSNSGNPVIF